MEDQRAMQKIMDLIRGFSLFFIFLNIYWFGYPFWKILGINHELSDELLQNINKSTGIFNNSWTTKLIAIFCLTLSYLGTKGVKSAKVSLNKTIVYTLLGSVLFFLNFFLLKTDTLSKSIAILYAITLIIGYLLLLKAGGMITRILKNDLTKDLFNEENETFPQEEKKMENQYAINLPTEFIFKKKKRKGWINVVNPFRGMIVLGTPGSGKSFAIINNVIKQHIKKGFAMYIYDYKFDDLSKIAYNILSKNLNNYKVKPNFYVINFDNPSKSHRCNPILASMMTDIVDAYESAYTIMLNLNKSWIQKQGDFFVESPINFLASIIWFLKIYKDGKYCTFPHVIEFLSREYDEIFPILGSYPELETYAKPFISAYRNDVMEQLEGQIASARIPLSRMVSPGLYWVMSGNDFTLDLNNPEAPKILCVGNNPERQSIYGAALGLYNARIVKLVNKKHRLKSSIIIDELPTIYFKGLDNLIATARSNKVSTCLGFQDFSQLERDYGKPEASVIINTVGNIFSGQVVGESAKQLSERFGRNLQKRESISISKESSSRSISTQLDQMIPASKISTLSQGYFVGSVADNFGEEIGQKVFHSKILVDLQKLQAEEKKYVDIPTITNFIDSEGIDQMEEILLRNFYQIKIDVQDIIEEELERLKKDREEANRDAEQISTEAKQK